MYKANKFYINGEWVSPSTNEECEVINPATEEVIGTVAMGSEVDVNKACLLYTSDAADEV